MFIGFASRKTAKRRGQLNVLSSEKRTLIFYESPRRIIGFIDDMIASMGDRQAVLGREMTKLHEEFIRGTLSYIKAELESRPSVKGECTLMVDGAPEEQVSMEIVLDEIKERLKEPGVRTSSLAKELSFKFNVPRRFIYEKVLEMSGKG